MDASMEAEMSPTGLPLDTWAGAYTRDAIRRMIRELQDEEPCLRIADPWQTRRSRNTNQEPQQCRHSVMWIDQRQSTAPADAVNPELRKERKEETRKTEVEINSVVTISKPEDISEKKSTGERSSTAEDKGEAKSDAETEEDVLDLFANMFIDDLMDEIKKNALDDSSKVPTVPKEEKLSEDSNKQVSQGEKPSAVAKESPTFTEAKTHDVKENKDVDDEQLNLFVDAFVYGLLEDIQKKGLDDSSNSSTLSAGPSLNVHDEHGLKEFVNEFIEDLMWKMNKEEMDPDSFISKPETKLRDATECFLIRVHMGSFSVKPTLPRTTDMREISLDGFAGGIALDVIRKATSPCSISSGDLGKQCSMDNLAGERSSTVEDKREAHLDAVENLDTETEEEVLDVLANTFIDDLMDEIKKNVLDDSSKIPTVPKEEKVSENLNKQVSQGEKPSAAEKKSPTFIEAKTHDIKEKKDVDDVQLNLFVDTFVDGLLEGIQKKGLDDSSKIPTVPKKEDLSENSSKQVHRGGKHSTSEKGGSTFTQAKTHDVKENKDVDDEQLNLFVNTFVDGLLEDIQKKGLDDSSNSSISSAGSSLNVRDEHGLKEFVNEFIEDLMWKMNKEEMDPDSFISKPETKLRDATESFLIRVHMGSFSVKPTLPRTTDMREIRTDGFAGDIVSDVIRKATSSCSICSGDLGKQYSMDNCAGERSSTVEDKGEANSDAVENLDTETEEEVLDLFADIFIDDLMDEIKKNGLNDSSKIPTVPKEENVSENSTKQVSQGEKPSAAEKESPTFIEAKTHDIKENKDVDDVQLNLFVDTFVDGLLEDIQKNELDDSSKIPTVSKALSENSHKQVSQGKKPSVAEKGSSTLTEAKTHDVKENKDVDDEQLNLFVDIFVDGLLEGIQKKGLNHSSKIPTVPKEEKLSENSDKQVSQREKSSVAEKGSSTFTEAKTHDMKEKKNVDNEQLNLFVNAFVDGLLEDIQKKGLDDSSNSSTLSAGSSLNVRDEHGLKEFVNEFIEDLMWKMKKEEMDTDSFISKPEMKLRDATESFLIRVQMGSFSVKPTLPRTTDMREISLDGFAGDIVSDVIRKATSPCSIRSGDLGKQYSMDNCAVETVDDIPGEGIMSTLTESDRHPDNANANLQSEIMDTQEVRSVLVPSPFNEFQESYLQEGSKGGLQTEHVNEIKNTTYTLVPKDSNAKVTEDTMASIQSACTSRIAVSEISEDHKEDKKNVPRKRRGFLGRIRHALSRLRRGLRR